MHPFTGYRDHRIDGKDRVVIPNAYAERIKEESDGRLFLVPSTEAPCLQAHPATNFERLSAAHVPDPIAPDQPKERHLFQNAEEAELKGPGRITLPKRFLGYFPTGLVRVAGMNTYLELWDPGTWEEHMASSAGPLPRPRPRAAGQ